MRVSGVWIQVLEMQHSFVWLGLFLACDVLCLRAICETLSPAGKCAIVMLQFE
jgi:hypothetical protein